MYFANEPVQQGMLALLQGATMVSERHFFPYHGLSDHKAWISNLLPIKSHYEYAGDWRLRGLFLNIAAPPHDTVNGLTARQRAEGAVGAVGH